MEAYDPPPEEDVPLEAVGESEGWASEDWEEPEGELGTAQQELLGILPSSCNDITGTDPVLAALAVATATELKRWQPTKDFTISWGRLALTATGKRQCADGKCFNTQAMLDLQNNAASQAEIRPGIKVSPLLVRTALTMAYMRQKTCFTLLGIPLIGCGVPEHRFELVGTDEGVCDTNYWFQAQTPSGAPLTATQMTSLEKGLIWVNTELNEYISFQVKGNLVGIDPTYGLVATRSSTTAGVCSAACTRISATDITGQCCSCNGVKKYVRSAWSPTTYLCK